MGEIFTPKNLQGTVVHFKGNGRKLGYPTANLASKTILNDGVYFGYADLGSYKNNPAIIFIGTPTTVGDTIRRVEAHLLGIPDLDYYGMHLKLRLEHFHRLNQTFNSVDDLTIKMRDDESSAINWFARRRKKAESEI